MFDLKNALCLKDVQSNFPLQGMCTDSSVWQIFTNVEWFSKRVYNSGVTFKFFHDEIVRLRECF